MNQKNSQFNQQAARAESLDIVSTSCHVVEHSPSDQEDHELTLEIETSQNQQSAIGLTYWADRPQQRPRFRRATLEACDASETRTSMARSSHNVVAISSLKPQSVTFDIQGELVVSRAVEDQAKVGIVQVDQTFMPAGCKAKRKEKTDSKTIFRKAIPPRRAQQVALVTNLVSKLHVHRGKKRPTFADFQARMQAVIGRLGQRMATLDKTGENVKEKLKVSNLISAHESRLQKMSERAVIEQMFNQLTVLIVYTLKIIQDTLGESKANAIFRQIRLRFEADQDSYQDLSRRLLRDLDQN